MLHQKALTVIELAGNDAADPGQVLHKEMSLHRLARLLL